MNVNEYKICQIYHILLDKKIIQVSPVQTGSQIVDQRS